MPYFKCPIFWCYYHNGEDCDKDKIDIQLDSTDIDRDFKFVCVVKENNFKCLNCGQEFKPTTKHKCGK